MQYAIVGVLSLLLRKRSAYNESFYLQEADLGHGPDAPWDVRLRMGCNSLKTSFFCSWPVSIAALRSTEFNASMMPVSISYSR
jgi:hypothetical protein